MILEIVSLVLLTPFLLIFEWLSFIVSLIKNFLIYFFKQNLTIKILFISTILQVIFSIKPWLSYKVNFVGDVETLYISTKVNLHLISTSMLLLLMVSMIKNNFIVKLFVFFESILFVYFSFLMIFPKPYLTDFQNSNDYTFTNSVYGYGISITTNLLISIYLMKNNPQKVEDLNVSTS
jgi:hypothetical protein